jgi:hypothetical protein
LRRLDGWTGLLTNVTCSVVIEEADILVDYCFVEALSDVDSEPLTGKTEDEISDEGTERTYACQTDPLDQQDVNLIVLLL